MKTLKNYRTNLKERNKNLIPSTYSAVTYLAPYFKTGMPDRFDLKYLGIDFGTLKLVTDEEDVLEDLVILAVENFGYKWEKLFATLSLEYNPIWNVEGKEIVTSVIASRHSENKYDDVHSETSGSEKAFDSDTYKETVLNKNDTDGHIDEFDVDGYTDEVTTQRMGNIGVTKTQDMINDERVVADFKYMDIVMKDIIGYITIPSFEEECHDC